MQNRRWYQQQLMMKNILNYSHPWKIYPAMFTNGFVVGVSQRNAFYISRRYLVVVRCFMRREKHHWRQTFNADYQVWDIWGLCNLRAFHSLYFNEHCYGISVSIFILLIDSWIWRDKAMSLFILRNTAQIYYLPIKLFLCLPKVYTREILLR